jgi:signal transduction histidine kinase
LRTFIELLEEDYATLSTQDAQHLMQALDRAVGRLQSLLDNLMDIGTIRSGQFTVRPLPSQLEGIIEEAVSQVEPLLKASGQPLERHDRTGLVVMADWQRVVQVLLNLLTNASKYSPENQPITLAVHSENGFVRIQVTDCGPGIAPEDQLHLFERFYRVKGNREGAVGIGLGLALSKAIVESLGGQIGLDTHPGQGTTFWFTLPLFQPEIGH